MHQQIQSFAIVGIQAVPVLVTAIPSSQLCLVGFSEARAREMRVRVLSALQRAGVADVGATVSLDGPGAAVAAFGEDCAVAAAVLALAGKLPDTLREHIMAGELGLDGTLRPTRGALCAARLAGELGGGPLLVPASCGASAVFDGGPVVDTAAHLSDLVAGTVSRASAEVADAQRPGAPADFADVPGAADARRALELAAVGDHNVLLVGPPGIGKTMLARRMTTIMAPLSAAEQLEIRAIYSAAGLAAPAQRPFRAPHHTVSAAALLGGGRPVRPGELSLAHHGVLFVDELPEFRRADVQALAAALRAGHVMRRWQEQAVELPGRARVIATALPCPCGWHGFAQRRCVCSSGAIERYTARLIELTRDWIDIRVVLEPVSLRDLRAGCAAESSSQMRRRVVEARFRRRGLEAQPRPDGRCPDSVDRLAVTIAALGAKTAVDEPSRAEAMRLCAASGAK